MIWTIIWKYSSDCFKRYLRQKQLDRPDGSVFYVPIACQKNSAGETIITSEPIIRKPDLSSSNQSLNAAAKSQTSFLRVAITEVNKMHGLVHRCSVVCGVNFPAVPPGPGP